VSRLSTWCLNAIYLLAILIASPWIVWSAIRYGKYREGFAQKLLGRVPRRFGTRPCIWLHAVSVGEVNLIGTTIAGLARRRPDCELVISTTTKTGYDLARQKYPDYSVFYCPIDFSWAVRQAMRCVRPDLLVLAELELWPNLIRSATDSGCHVAIINGRMSDRSFRGYQRLKRFVAPVLRRVKLFAVSDNTSADRFVQLGADLSAVYVTGSQKFDGAQTDRANGETQRLRDLAGITNDQIVLLVGSTQAPEEEHALQVFDTLRHAHPRLRLLLAPRHPHRFDEVAQLLERSGLPWSRRSQLPDSAIRNPHSAILIDSIGELGAWWGVADIGLVGGSFGSRGGQNMLEPAAYGVATCFGPKTKNFRDIVAQLLAVEGAVVVNNRSELERFVRRALDDPTWRRELGQRARELVLSQQGATERTLDLLLPLVASQSECRSASRPAA